MVFGLNQPVNMGGVTGRKRNTQFQQYYQNLLILHITCTVIWKWPLAIRNAGTEILS
jgi:hypothetical protein